MSELLESIVQVSKAWSLPAGSRIILPTPKTPVTVRGDYDLLHQAFANLVRNAFQAMPGGGEVQIHLEMSEDASSVVLTIADHGVGLADEDLKRVGQPFFTKRGGGIGLGFSLARRVITEHGGTLSATSMVGKGTSVIVSLPVFQPVQETCPATYPGHRLGKKGCDDDGPDRG
jgi:signal transduction histidine kinase